MGGVGRGANRDFYHERKNVRPLRVIFVQCPLIVERTLLIDYISDSYRNSYIK